jgi:hypothetical protein
MPKRNRTTNGFNALRRKFEMLYAELALFIVKLLGVAGPYTLALDRTNWKVGILRRLMTNFERFDVAVWWKVVKLLSCS